MPAAVSDDSPCPDTDPRHDREGPSATTIDATRFDPTRPTTDGRAASSRDRSHGRAARRSRPARPTAAVRQPTAEGSTTRCVRTESTPGSCARAASSGKGNRSARRAPNDGPRFSRSARSTRSAAPLASIQSTAAGPNSSPADTTSASRSPTPGPCCATPTRARTPEMPGWRPAPTTTRAPDADAAPERSNVRWMISASAEMSTSVAPHSVTRSTSTVVAASTQQHTTVSASTTRRRPSASSTSTSVALTPRRSATCRILGSVRPATVTCQPLAASTVASRVPTWPAPPTTSTRRVAWRPRSAEPFMAAHRSTSTRSRGANPWGSWTRSSRGDGHAVRRDRRARTTT